MGEKTPGNLYSGMVISSIDRLARQFCNRAQGCGVVVAVIRQGRIVYADAYGSLSLKTPVAVASLSKPVFAYAVLKLWEQSILDLDKPLVKYFPQPYISDDPYLPFVTARHILSHTSGFPNWRDEKGLRIAFQPGSSFHYSTEGFIYLQSLVEHLLGQPLQDYMALNLFNTLGMDHSLLVPEDISTFRSFLPQGLRAYGGISLHTTVLDYARFLVYIMQDESSNAHLAPGMVDEMLSSQTPVGSQAGLSWGLGWGLQHETGHEDSFWHWGARRNLTRCFAMGYRKNQSGVVIFTTHEEGLTVCEEITKSVLEHPGQFPSFLWLLPPENWRADGTI